MRTTVYVVKSTLPTRPTSNGGFGWQDRVISMFDGFTALAWQAVVPKGLEGMGNRQPASDSCGRTLVRQRHAMSLCHVSRKARACGIKLTRANKPVAADPNETQDASKRIFIRFAATSPCPIVLEDALLFSVPLGALAAMRYR